MFFKGRKKVILEVFISISVKFTCIGLVYGKSYLKYKTVY